ncbi:tetratricopeptide repeat protein [Tahibacter amnicola]|uniref:Tetratricopeptide repeat protein n=1 Tax=Tahibacter amnicola TaxID=2976241 RepID=A0ABY6BD15_9GAMM|nr:tetratricopeptide repeat protein [Tahibacter amnicola]UXI67697.1 tetratricopeptide repeat protein [Tahibacter amnicola]
MRRFLPSFAYLALLIPLAWAAYAPGLSGDFLFDDFVNLSALSANGRVDNWPAFWRYITSGIADPTGRPLSLLSFLIDAQTWPADPYPFKRTNLLLHLFNGALLFALLSRIGAIRGMPAGRHRTAAAIAAGCWLLHPLLVSTTLYVVQREAMLPATFTLLGLLAYVHGDHQVSLGHVRRGLLWIAGGIGLGTFLAVLCKANGALLPLLALALRFTLLEHREAVSNPVARRRADWIFLILPSLGLVALLLAQIPSAIRIAESVRPWSMDERLLTECRILFDYLAKLVVPRPFTAGLYNDDILVSTGWTTPWQTLPAVAGIVGLIGGAIYARKTYPALAGAVLFFFAGHAMESSVLALELYFEHRNYLSALLLFWPLACLLTEPSRWWGRGAWFALPLLAMLAWMTHERATLWGNPREQVLVWARLNPDSPRAQVTAAIVEMKRHRYELAEARLSKVMQKYPDDPQILFNLVGARCGLGTVAPSDIDAAARAVARTKTSTMMTFHWIESMVSVATSGQCAGLDLAVLTRLVEASRQNPRVMAVAGRRQELHYLDARIALGNGDGDAALASFNAALDEDFRLEVAIKQAALLGEAGFPDQGLAHLAHYDKGPRTPPRQRMLMARIHAWVLERQGYLTGELARIRATLEQDSIAKAKHPAT